MERRSREGGQKTVENRASGRVPAVYLAIRTTPPPPSPGHHYSGTRKSGFSRQKFNRRKTSRWFPTRSLTRRRPIPGVNILYSARPWTARTYAKCLEVWRCWQTFVAIDMFMAPLRVIFGRIVNAIRRKWHGTIPDTVYFW